MNQTATIDRQGTVSDFATPPLRGEVVPFKEAPIQRAYPPKIAKAIMAITREFGAIAKGKNENDPNGGWNKFHNYGYQKWEDVLERESTLVALHGIIIQQSEVARSLLEKLISISYEFTLVNEDGDCWPDRPVFTAIGRLIDNKGIFDDKAANKCHTQAHKYFLLHTFKIKTKESAADDADSADDEAAPAAPPKPPRPGSAEAQKMEGPRPITGTGPDPQAWADTFLAGIDTAKSPDEIDQWVEKNKDTLDRLQGARKAIYDSVAAGVGKKRGSFLVETTPAIPKPPKPGSAPVAKAMPDPATDAAGWLKWLADKLAGFESYEAGETFWNDTIQALDLPMPVQEDAMGAWRRFEDRHAP